MCEVGHAKALGGELVAFIHSAPVCDNMECRDLLEILWENQIRHCCFGHIHGEYAAKKVLAGSYRGVEMHLISCDYVNFAPVLIP